MSENETRTMTAAEVAQDAELWRQVERGEVQVRSPRTHMHCLAARLPEPEDDCNPENVMLLFANLGWTAWRGPDRLHVVVPVAVERLKARIAALEAENAALAADTDMAVLALVSSVDALDGDAS